jgi:hypothetical protein
MLIFFNCCVMVAFIRAETCSTITSDSKSLSTQQFRFTVPSYLLNHLRITRRCLTLKSDQCVIFLGSVLFFLSSSDSAVNLNGPFTNILNFYSSSEYATIFHILTNKQAKYQSLASASFRRGSQGSDRHLGTIIRLHSNADFEKKIENTLN